MSLLVWNCRGLGNPQTIRELGDIVRAKDPAAVFIAETWLDEARLKSLLKNFELDQKFVVSKVNQGGGLALLWKSDFDVSVVSSSLNYIDVVINAGKENSWRFSGFYGCPETHRHQESWNMLRNLSSSSSLPWLCAGDFNEIAKSHEKLGGRARPENQMKDFREALDACCLADLGYRGTKFTWCKKLTGGITVWERLDRAVANTEWFSLFPGSSVTHLDATFSDHKPLFIQLDGISIRNQRPWRFEQVWLKEEACHTTVEAAWENSIFSPNPMVVVEANLRTCHDKLREWSRGSFGNITRNILEKKRQVKEAEKEAIRGIGVDRLHSLKAELRDLLLNEEKLWQQRSKLHWLKEGDQNTGYFHSRASQRFRRNCIKRLRNDSGEWCEGDDHVADLFCDYFRGLFSTSNPSHLEEVLATIPRVVSDSMNSELMKNFSRQEVDAALKSMAPLKAPGPDGMPPIFFQHYWDSIGEDVSCAVLSCLKTGIIPASLNHTFITLIPKSKSPERVSEFRPIALCNILYKLISKVLANRLKSLLPHVISESQSAFQPDKAISDNILVAFETLHHMKTQKTGKEGYMALKLDMSKAYDRVEWIFLEKLMLKMGFHANWVRLVMETVRTVSYSILINGTPRGCIKPTRGIRQGDPLSPYLFLLCSEGLNGLIKSSVASGDLRGFSLCKNGPQISHLFFADDSVIFCRAKMGDVQALQSALILYEQASGQKVNGAKTNLFFGKSVPECSKVALKNFLGVPEIKEYEKYLGLPAVVGRNKKESLIYIKERIWSKLQGWKEKLLSQAGREILLKAVVQAIPTFAMSCFKLPMSLCHDIEVMIKNFFWGQRGDRKRIHWKKWETLCLPKIEGGMGFKELQKFNEAMLAKQVWRLIHDKNSLFYRVFKAKFFPSGDIFSAQVKTGSYAWRSILSARKVIASGARWRIGTGHSVKVYQDCWLPGEGSGRIISSASSLPVDMVVADLIDDNTGWWNGMILDTYFLPFEAQKIRSIPICFTPQEDILIWPKSKDGMYSVKSGYQLLGAMEKSEVASVSDNGEVKKFWSALWRLNVPNKIKSFAWRAISDCLPTLNNLARRKIVLSNVCLSCKKEPETVMHALWGCDNIRVVWGTNFDELRNATNQFFSFFDLFRLALQNIKGAELFLTYCWSIWNRRNKLRVKEAVTPLEKMADQAQQYLMEFQQSRSKPVSKKLPKKIIWKPPDPGTVKTNFDGAVFEDLGAAGIGVVVRNSSGTVLAALSEIIPCPSSVLALETIAARRAAHFLQELNIRGSVLEGDSETSISAIKNQCFHHPEVGHIIKDIMSLVGSFQYFSFSHTRRQGNALAHALARRARLSFPISVWKEYVPPDIYKVYVSDFLAIK